jgi:REP element-mobilizing transposase RayT
MEEQSLFRRRNLPHWDMPGAVYFVTACLDGSIPAEGLLDLTQYQEELSQRPIPDSLTPMEWERHIWKLRFARMDEWLDTKPACRHLADKRLARLVSDACYFFAGDRYDLLAYCIMPSHMHWVFQPRAEWVKSLPVEKTPRSPRERIMHSRKLHTAIESNRLLGLTGEFWQHESYDHWVRDLDELERIIFYVENNPVKAGLITRKEDWEFSSAYDRIVLGIPNGPLVRPKTYKLET